MKVGDLVKIVSNDAPFNLRPGAGSVGMIIEIRYSNFSDKYCYVYIDNVGWRYSEKELEVISDGSG